MPTSSAPEASQQAPVTPGAELGPRRARRAAQRAADPRPTAPVILLDPSPVTTPSSATAEGRRRGRRRADAVVDALPTPGAGGATAATSAISPTSVAAPAPAPAAATPVAPTPPVVLVLPETPVVTRPLPSRRELRTTGRIPVVAAPTAAPPVSAPPVSPVPAQLRAPVPAPRRPASAAPAVAAHPTTGSLVRVPRGVVPAPTGADAFAPDRGRRTHREPTRSAFGLPQIGLVGVLGLVTMITPVVGQLASAEADTGPTTTTSAASVTTAAGSALSLAPVSAELATATGETSSVATGGTAGELDPGELQARLQAAEQASRDIGERTLEQQAQAAVDAQVAELTDGCTGEVPAGALEAENGQLDTAELCSLWQPGMMLRADAAVALAKLDLAYRAEFGTDLVLSDAYRTYASQVRLRATKPGLAAVPGTSEHGWGLAVDLGGGVQNSDEHYDWLVENAPAYGWSNPDWARSGGSGPHEPWHWEFGTGDTTADTTE